MDQQETSASTTPKSSSQSPNLARLGGLSHLSRLQNSVTKADLSQRSKEGKSNLKEKGAALKQALLENTSILPKLSLDTGLLRNISDNSSISAGKDNTVKPASYKELVLSVLYKKKSTHV